MRIVFFGTPPIAASVLKYLHTHGVNIVAAVSKPDKPRGRSKALLPTAVKETALVLGIPVLQPEIASSPEFVKTLEGFQPDLIVVVAYGEIVRQNVLNLPKLGCINLHASLLPEYRGAAPMQRALIDGKPETGVTIMHMVRKLDAGAIIRQSKIPLPLTMNLEELKDAVIEDGEKLLLDVIADFERGIPDSIPQDETRVTLAPKVETSECKLNFHRSALDLHNLVRGVSPVPGAFFIARIRGIETPVKVYRSIPIIVEQELQTPPSIVQIIGKKRLLISCLDGFLEILELQTAGKKRIMASEWIAGAPKEGIEIIHTF